MTASLVRGAMCSVLLLLAACSSDPGAPSDSFDPTETDGTNLGSPKQEKSSPAEGSTAPTTPDAGAEPEPTDPEPVTPEKPSKKVLNIAWQGQETTYWCGPGSTRIALSAKVDAAKLPSQTTLAKELPTTVYGTDHISFVQKVLNARIPGANYKNFDVSEPPTPAQRAKLKADLVRNIDQGYALVANVVSGWRPPTYPAGTIYHYVAVVGYEDNGDKAVIADPAALGHGSPGFSKTPKTYTISTFDLGTWVGAKGYAAR